MASTNTSLIANFSSCESGSCNSIILTDSTGEYSAGNTSGFGSPNPEITEVTGVSLVITTSTGTQITLDITDLSSGIYPQSPYSISLTDLNMSDQIVDDVWTLQIIYSGTTIQGASIFWTSTTTKTILYSCQTQCCLDKLMASISINDCGCCNDSPLAKVMKGNTFLKAARLAASCGQPKKALKLLAAAKFICQSKQCINC
jgi:hypothetical protein